MLFEVNVICNRHLLACIVLLFVFLVMPTPVAATDVYDQLNFPTTTYRIETPNFKGWAACEDAHGYILIGSPSGIHRFDGSSEWEHLMEKSAIHLQACGNVIYGASINGIFRFKSSAMGATEFKALGPALVSAGLSKNRLSGFRESSMIGGEAFFVQTWFIARVSPNEDGTDRLSVIQKRHALPSHLKFRRVFAIAGKPCVQLENMKNSSEMHFGWVEDDNSITLIEDLTINDHIITCVQSTDDRNSGRFTCAGLRRVFAVDVGEVPGAKFPVTPKSVRELPAPFANLKNSTFGQMSALPDGRIAMKSRQHGAFVIDTSGKPFGVIGARISPVVPAMYFTDSQGRFWISDDQKINRVDYGGTSRFWIPPDEFPIHSLAMSEKVVYFATDTDIFRAEIFYRDTGPALGEFKPIFETLHRESFVRVIGDHAFCSYLKRLFIIDANDVNAKPQEILEGTSSDIVYSPEADAYFLTCKFYARPIVKLVHRDGKWESEEIDSFESNSSSPVIGPNSDIWISIFNFSKGWTVLRISAKTGKTKRYWCQGYPFVFEDQLFAYSMNNTKFFRFDSESDKFVKAPEWQQLADSSTLFNKRGGWLSKAALGTDGAIRFSSRLQSFIEVSRDPSGALVAKSIYKHPKYAGGIRGVVDDHGNHWHATGNRLHYWKHVDDKVVKPDVGAVIFSSLTLTGGDPTLDEKTMVNDQEPLLRRPLDNLQARYLPFKQKSESMGATSYDFSAGTLEINYSYARTIAPELVYFSTRMLGLDDAWSTPTRDTSREFPALRENKYRFQVKAILPDGRESEPSTLEVTVHPPWFRTKATYASVIGTILILIIGFVRWRVRLERRQVARLQVEIDERITAQQKLVNSQAQLVKRERLRALGELAAGAAHDINNILTPAGVYASIMKEDPSLPPSVIEAGNVIDKCVQDAANIVQRIHPLYGWTSPELEIVPVAPIIDEVIVLTRARINELSPLRSIEVRGKAEPADLLCNSSDIREILINILNNAVDAIEGDGNILVHSYVQATNLVIEVQDDGIGMNEKNKKNCLRSFYSTKENRSSGLGLATTTAILNSYEGSIEVESEVGAGSLFRVTFPLKRSLELAAPEVRSAALPSKRILLVEDIEPTREAVQRLLETMDQTVLCCNSPEVFDVLQETQIDVLLTDYDMPEVNGFDLCVGVRQQYPSIRRIVMSGYETPGLSEVCDVFVSKPISATLLRNALLEVEALGPEVRQSEIRLASL